MTGRRPQPLVDRAGQRFGRLVITELSHFEKSDTNSHRFWHCVCDCGKRKIIRATSLAEGKTQSCGCLRRDRRKIRTADEVHAANWRTLVRLFKNNAKNRGYEWCLSNEEALALAKGDCAYCGAHPGMLYGKRNLQANGIDRIDNDKGYIPGNAASCCPTCNYAKRTMTVDEFVSWARRVVAHNEA